MQVGLCGSAEQTVARAPVAAHDFSAMQLGLSREEQIYNDRCRVVMCVRMEPGL